MVETADDSHATAPVPGQFVASEAMPAAEVVVPEPATQLDEECPDPFVDLPSEVAILRFVPTNNDYLPPGSPFPTRKAFEPSTGDKDEARERARPVSVSVWDRRRSTVGQVRALRPTPKPQVVFEVHVGTVVGIGTVDAVGRLKVFTDPIVPTKGPGSFGHCGIEGCATPRGDATLSKVAHKAMLDKLACACVRIDDE